MRAMVTGLIADLEGFEVIKSCANLKEAFAAFDDGRIDVMVLDLNIPFNSTTAESVDDGVECGRQIKRISPETKIVVCTNNEGLDAVQLCRDFSDVIVEKMYLSEDDHDVLGEALEAAVAGIPYIKARDPEAHRRAQTARYGFTERKNRIGTEDEVSREWTIIAALYRGMTNDQIAKSLTISKRTVETHRRSIGGKVAGVEGFSIGPGGDFRDHGAVADWYAREHFMPASAD